jgi:superfamily II DNA or RNA helicase
MMACVGAYASEDENNETYKRIEGNCKALSKTNALIMKARQNNMSMSEVMEIVGSEKYDKNFQKHIRGVIIRAYDSPRFTLESYQQQAIDDFENEAMLNCIRGAIRY